MPASPCRRAYDHRLRDLVCEERDPMLFRDLGSLALHRRKLESVAAPVPSSPPRSLPWTSRNSRPRSSPSSAGSGSSLPSWPPLHTPRKLSHLPSPSACCASPLPASTLGPVPHGIAPSTIGPVALTQRQCGLRHPHQPPAGLQHKHGAAAKALSATKASVITRVRRVQRMRNEERQGVE